MRGKHMTGKHMTGRGKKKILAVLTAMAVMAQSIIPAGTVWAASANANASEVKQTVDAQQEETIINVEDYGAIPGGKGDSTVPVQKALEAAKAAKGPVRLYFPKGEYHFYKDFATKREWHTSNTSSLSNPTKWIGFLIEGQENLTVDGGGSTFMMHGDIMAMAVAKSKNVTLENFVLDYEVPDTMDITVVGKGENEEGKKYTDMYIPANYHYEITEDEKHINWMSELSPFTGKRYWQDQDTLSGYLVIYKGYDETVRRHNTTISYEGKTEKDADPFVGVESIRKIGDNKVRFTYKNRVPEAQEEGNVYLLCNSARRRTCGAFIWESEDTLVRDIDVHYLSGFGWLTQMSKNTEFNSVNFLPREGTGKYTTSNADQIHVAGAGGYFNVIDCNFSMAHDDPINIHGTYLRVEEVIDDQTLKLKYIHGQQGGFPAYFPGDQVTFYSRTNLEVPTGVQDEDTFEVESAVNPGEAYGDGKLSMRETVVRFTTPFPESVKKCLEVKIKRGTDPNAAAEEEPLYVAENVTYAANVHIKGNIMRSIPTRGILCTTRNQVVIEDNVFESLAMASIYLSNDADYWYESGPIRNMTIRNNTFNVRPTGQTEWATVSPIFVDPVIVNQAVAAPGYELPAVKGDPVHKNIVVEGNTFNMRAFNLVTATGVDGFTFRNNKVYRDTMNLDLTLNSDKTRLQVGETASLHGSVKEDLLDTDAFIFRNCKDVVIEGNTYDDGMNLNVKLNGNMTQEDVTIEKDPLTIGDASNVITSESKVQYISLDPDIVRIGRDGKATAVKEGKASILAYCRWKNSIVRSGILDLTVSGEVPHGSMTITGESLIEEKDGTLQLGVETEGLTGACTWTVVDAFTDRATAAAAISNQGLLTGMKDGIVKVKAAIGAFTAEKLVVISLPESYGIKSEEENNLKREVQIVNENAANWRGTGAEDAIRIIGENGDLYGNNNSAKNIITYDIPADVPKDDLRVQVTADGLPRAGDNYNAAGLMLFKDVDNYIRVGTKGHMGSGIATDNEMNRSDSENVKGSPLAGRKAILEIERTGTVTTLRYKDLAAGAAWSEPYEIADMDSLGDDFRIALCGWNKDIVALTVDFSGLKIGKASEVTTEELELQAPKPIFSGVANTAPTAANCQVAGDLKQGGRARAAFEYADAEGHSQNTVLYHWSWVSEGGRTDAYTLEPELRLTNAGSYTCEIYVTDEYQKPCKTPGKANFEVEEVKEEDILVTGIEVNGNALPDFSSDVTEYEYAYPTEAREAYISAICKNSSYGDIKITDSQNRTLAISEELFEIPEDGIVNLVRTGEKDGEEIAYTIHFTVYDVNHAGISDIKIGDNSCSLIKQGANGYFAAIENEDNVQALSFATDAGVKSVRVTRSFYNTEIPGTLNGTSYRTQEVNLYSGLNIFHAFVEAADGSVTEHVIQVFRSGYSECDAQAISLNGSVLERFDKDTLNYQIHMKENEAKNLKLEAEIENGKDITASILFDGKRTEGSVLSIPTLSEGMHKAVFTVRSENQWTEKQYEVVIIVEKENNSSLLTLESSIALSPMFDENVVEYTAKTTKDKVTLKAVSQHRDAKVYIESLEKTDQGMSAAQSDISLYEGENNIAVRVVAPDRSEKVYNICITANGYEYLSDIKAESIQNGYGSLGYDTSNSGGTITLADEKGEAMTFEKGLGGHAPSEFVYMTEGKGYTYFEAMVGIDYVQYQTNLSSVIFKVYFDDEQTPVWESGLMGSQTPAKAISLDLTGVKKIRLVTDDYNGNSYDHADWADAKFLKPLAEAPQNPDPVLPTDILVSPENASIQVGKTVRLTAKVLPGNVSDQSINWTSENAGIATVDAGGNVTGQREGTVRIVAFAKSNAAIKAACTVQVTTEYVPDPPAPPVIEKVKVEKITLSKQKAKMAVGSKVTLKPVLYPANASDQTVKYQTSNKSIATVSSSGRVTAKKIGKVTITVLSGDGNAKAQWKFSVVPKTPKLLKARRVSASTAKLNWKKISGADGYKIYVSNKKASGYKCRTTVKKAKTLSTVINRLNKKKTSYVKVTAFKKVKGKTYISELSNYKVLKKKK